MLIGTQYNSYSQNCDIENSIMIGGTGEFGIEINCITIIPPGCPNTQADVEVEWQLIDLNSSGQIEICDLPISSMCSNVYTENVDLGSMRLTSLEEGTFENGEFIDEDFTGCSNCDNTETKTDNFSPYAGEYILEFRPFASSSLEWLTYDGIIIVPESENNSYQ